MMVLIYVTAHNFHSGMLLDSQFGMVHENLVYIPHHENVAFLASAGKNIALICAHCLFAILSTAYLTAYCSLISLLTVLLNSINLFEGVQLSNS